MKKYFFVFGRDPLLCRAEACAFLEKHSPDFKFRGLGERTALVETVLEAEELQRELAGTVKIGEILSQGNAESVFRELKEKDFFPSGKKFFYCLNDFSRGKRKEFREIAGIVKGKAKNERLKAVLKHPKPHGKEKEFVVNPSEVERWKLLRKGLDLLVEFSGKKVFAGKTVSCSNPKESREKDLGKPEQRPLHTLSVRVAGILVNLSGAKPGETLLDPFCGIGTILQEAMQRGINSAGVDTDKEAVGKAKKNLEWFKKKFGCRAEWKVMEGDAGKVHGLVREADAAATEPFLGPFIKETPSRKDAEKTAGELESLYSKFFESLEKVLKEKGRAAVILPCIPLREGGFFCVKENVFRENGFTDVSLKGAGKIFPVELKEESKIKRNVYLLEKR